jgi:hypothetical protein
MTNHTFFGIIWVAADAGRITCHRLLAFPQLNLEMLGILMTFPIVLEAIVRFKPINRTDMAYLAAKSLVAVTERATVRLRMSF